MHRRLALFDIDGTLLSAVGAGKRALGRALLEIYGTAGPIEHWDFGGKTDPQICHELMTEAGLATEEIQAKLDRVLACYIDYLTQELRDVVVYPGVYEVLDALQEVPNVTLGILTGNVSQGAELKLKAIGVSQYFLLGAFGSDSALRSDLVDVALERAFQEVGYRFTSKEIAIIGDTPHDIRCGRHRGVKAIAVATGPYSSEELSLHDPDYLFGDFSQPEQVVAAILA